MIGAMVWLLVIVGCRPDPDDRPVYPDDDTAWAGPDDTVWSDTTTESEDCGACPCGMAPVGAADAPAFCVDVFEALVAGDLGNTEQGRRYPDGSTTAVATQAEGIPPTLHVTWYQAWAACDNAGKHLCTVAEWQDACDSVPGEGGGYYPWGDAPPPEDVCAAPAADGTTVWEGVQAVGSRPDCHGPDGAFDLSGNAWEWADPEEAAPDGNPLAAKVGGSWYAGYGSLSCLAGANLEHPAHFEGDIAARCCAVPL
jgi:hypothetical protein